VARPQAALTRRERRVKEILLKELKKLASWQGLTYAEKQHIEKRLNVEFLDREIANLKKHIRWMKRGTPVILLYAAFYTYFVLRPDSWLSFALSAVLLLVYSLSPFFLARSIRRKLFIYEALRELSDADEIDVVLDRAAREADELIDRIVARELEADRRFPANPARLADRI
jgi:hypothetical protein